MKTSAKPKQPTYYPRADQLPYYTPYGWRRLRPGEIIKSTDFATSCINNVDFLLPDDTRDKPPGTPCFGFLPIKDSVYLGLGTLVPEDNHLIYIRKWFPNRNPLLKDKKP